MLPTKSQLRDLYPLASAGHLNAFDRQAADLLGQYGIADKTLRLHYFLAQIGHEAGGLTVTSENLNYSASRLMAVWPRRFPTMNVARSYARKPEKLANYVYGNRMGNGGAETGDGWRFRGRGFIQITGRDGYRRVGDIAGIDLENNPDLAMQPSNSLLVACAFWKWKKLNAICDRGNYLSVTRRINGGFNGLADRKAWLTKVRRILGGPAQYPIEIEVQQIIDVQRALQEAGYPEVGAADGVVGSNTIGAITRFRLDHGLPEGGIDKRLLRALGLD